MSIYNYGKHKWFYRFIRNDGYYYKGKFASKEEAKAAENERKKELNDQLKFGGGPKDHTYTQGEKHGNHKLVEEEIYEIREIYRRGLATQTELAGMFGVVQPHIWNIIHWKNWKHLPKEK